MENTIDLMAERAKRTQIDADRDTFKLDLSGDTMREFLFAAWFLQFVNPSEPFDVTLHYDPAENTASISVTNKEAHERLQNAYAAYMGRR